MLVTFPRKDVPYVMFFAKDDLADQLHRPLRRTLARPNGPLPQSLSESERSTIDELTIPRQYRAMSRDEGGGVSALVPRSALMQRDPLLACTIGSAYW